MLQAAPFLGARVLDPVGQHPGGDAELLDEVPDLELRAATGVQSRPGNEQARGLLAHRGLDGRRLVAGVSAGDVHKFVCERAASLGGRQMGVEPDRRAVCAAREPLEGDRVHVDAWLNHRSPGIDMYSNLRWAGDRHKDGPAPLRCGAIAAALGGAGCYFSSALVAVHEAEDMSPLLSFFTTTLPL